jgi:hypothetical protein
MDRPQFSLIPSEPYRSCIIWCCQFCPPGNPTGRFWLHGQALVALNRDEKIESLPERISPARFMETTQLCWTDWQNEVGIEPDYNALIRVLELEPSLAGRCRIVPPFGGARRLKGLPPPLGET